MKNFGQILKNKREELGLSLDAIEEKTKVRQHFLRDIENGKFDNLPDVYAKSFTKTYAQELKFPEREIEKHLSEIFDKPKPPAAEPPVEREKPKQEIQEKEADKPKEKKAWLSKKQKPAESAADAPQTTKSLDSESLDDIFFGNKEKKGSKLKKNLKYIGLSLLGVGLVILVIILFMPDKNNGPNAFVQGTQESENLGSEAVGQEDIVPDKFTLTATALDTTSFKIHVDGQTDESITLYPGKSKTWEATEKFELSGVTIGAVEFIRDNINLEMNGENGSRVRDLTIYRDKIESSTVEVEDNTDTTSAQPLQVPYNF